MKTLATTLIFFFTFTSLATAQVDYSESIQPIFSSNCTSCHGGTNGVSLHSYDAVMNSVGAQYQKNVVIPGEPDESPLVDKIENSNPEFGVRMPQGGPFLSSDEIDLIRTWIAEGANEVPVSNEITSIVPDDFSIVGNYPNPFNPQTIILFETPQKVSYSVRIYSTTGVLVRELAGISNGSQTEIKVSLNEMPSGIYLYQVKISDGNREFYLEPQKMTLAK